MWYPRSGYRRQIELHGVPEMISLPPNIIMVGAEDRIIAAKCELDPGRQKKNVVLIGRFYIFQENDFIPQTEEAGRSGVLTCVLIGIDMDTQDFGSQR